MPQITYDVEDLYSFIDQLQDMAALVLDKSSGTYRPHNKNWIKQKCFEQLKRQMR